jgi:hypothetical protein
MGWAGQQLFLSLGIPVSQASVLLDPCARDNVRNKESRNSGSASAHKAVPARATVKTHCGLKEAVASDEKKNITGSISDPSDLVTQPCCITLPCWGASTNRARRGSRRGMKPEQGGKGEEWELPIQVHDA